MRYQFPIVLKIFVLFDNTNKGVQQSFVIGLGPQPGPIYFP
jgi:hypothetical protein